LTRSCGVDCEWCGAEAILRLGRIRGKIAASLVPQVACFLVFEVRFEPSLPICTVAANVGFVDRRRENCDLNCLIGALQNSKLWQYTQILSNAACQHVLRGGEANGHVEER